LECHDQREQEEEEEEEEEESGDGVASLFSPPSPLLFLYYLSSVCEGQVLFMLLVTQRGAGPEEGGTERGRGCFMCTKRRMREEERPKGGGGGGGRGHG